MRKGYSSRQFQSDFRSRQASGQSASITFSQADFADVPLARRSRWLKGASRVAMVALGVCTVAVTLVAFNIGSKPALSAADIILMDGYGGRQPVPDLITPASIDHSERTSAPTVSIQEISARTNPTGLHSIAPQIIDMHFATATPAAKASTEIHMQVLQQWSNLRASPDISGDIIASLEVADVVTVLGQTDRWMHVRTDSNQTGYMHRSLLAEH